MSGYDPWRYTCPHGHRSVQRHKYRAWCQACYERGNKRHRYDMGELVDLKADVGAGGDV